jgi:hypothetical protein
MDFGAAGLSKRGRSILSLGVAVLISAVGFGLMLLIVGWLARLGLMWLNDHPRNAQKMLNDWKNNAGKPWASLHSQIRIPHPHATQGTVR